MKKTFLFAIFLLFSVCINAQKITQFMGIPIDGTESEMTQKLKQKGFTYDSYHKCLTGEFNGSDVCVFVATNKGKVWRIMVVDKQGSSERDIKIRYNTLATQFEKNPRYMEYSQTNTKISDEENIDYEMIVHNKRYQMVYNQISNKELDEIEEQCRAGNNYNDPTLTEEQRKAIKEECAAHSLFVVENNIVWFTINEKGGYRICIYYDNGFNQAHGEDL